MRGFFGRSLVRPGPIIRRGARRGPRRAAVSCGVLIGLVAVAAAVAAEPGATGGQGDPDEAILAGRGVAPTAEAIGAFLRSAGEKGLSREDYAALIRQLGDDSWRRREQATKTLAESLVVYRDLLEQAARSEDMEVGIRAQRILAALASRPAAERLDGIVAAALRVAARRRLKGLTAPVLAAVAQFPDDDLARLAVAAIRAAPRAEDAGILRKALRHALARVRLAAVRALPAVPGAAAGDFAPLLTDADARVRLSAAVALANLGDRRALKALAGLLACEDEGVRFRTAHVLAALTGRKIDTPALADPKAAAKAAEAWRAWVWREGRAARLNLPVREGGEGPVYHWSFDDGTAADCVSGVKGKVVGPVAFQPGIRGRAAAFKNHTTKIVVDSPKLDLNGWRQATLSLWVKMIRYSTYGRIISCCGPGRTRAAGVGLSIGGRGSQGWFPGGFAAYCDPAKGGGRSVFAATLRRGVKPIPKLRVWYHLVGTYDGRKVRMYVNGKLDGAEATKVPGNLLWWPRGSQMVIGRSATKKYDTWRDTYLGGLVDEIKIWRRALPADEVRRLYERSAGRPATRPGR